MDVDDYYFGLILGFAFGVLCMIIVFGLVLTIAIEREELSFFGERFVRVSAEQEDVEDFVDRWCEFEEFTSKNSNECVVLKGMQICASYYVPENVWRRC